MQEVQECKGCGRRVLLTLLATMTLMVARGMPTVGSPDVFLDAHAGPYGCS